MTNKKVGWKEVRLPRWEEAPKKGKIIMILNYDATELFYVDVVEEKTRYIFEKNSGSGLKVMGVWLPPTKEEVEGKRKFYRNLKMRW